MKKLYWNERKQRKMVLDHFHGDKIDYLVPMEDKEKADKREAASKKRTAAAKKAQDEKPSGKASWGNKRVQSKQEE